MSLLVFHPAFCVAPDCKYFNIYSPVRLEYGAKSGAILGYLFISEALTLQIMQPAAGNNRKHDDRGQYKS